MIDTEIKVLEKGLDFAPIHKKLKEPGLRSNFNEFCRRTRLKWHFRDESESFSEVPVFNLKSRWQPPQGHPCLEVFLSQVENELFELPKADIEYSNLSREEWNAIRSLADDGSIIIKKADKGSCIVIWSRNDYLMEAEKQLSDKKVYQEVSNSENILSKLAEMSNKMFNFISFPKFIKGCTMSQVGQLFRIAVHLQKNARNF